MISYPRLWSLGEMYHLNAGRFVEVARLCGQFEGQGSARPELDRGPIPLHRDPLTGDVPPDEMVTFFEGVQRDCEQMGLRVSATSCRHIKTMFKSKEAKFKDLREKYQEFQGRLRDELYATMCFAIEPRYVTYYTETRRFGEAVATRFGPAADDIEEAGKCLALGRPTASVFHLMRALEVGLQALAQKLGIVLEKDRNWQAMINDVNGAIKQLARSTREEKEFLGKCSATVLFLEQVKDAWRNDVMHPRATYTEEQAQEIDGFAKSLMGKLAEFV